MKMHFFFTKIDIVCFRGANAIKLRTKSDKDAKYTGKNCVSFYLEIVMSISCCFGSTQFFLLKYYVLRLLFFDFTDLLSTWSSTTHGKP